jgi:hypothetical protein
MRPFRRADERRVDPMPDGQRSVGNTRKSEDIDGQFDPYRTSQNRIGDPSISRPVVRFRIASPVFSIARPTSGRIFHRVAGVRGWLFTGVVRPSFSR